MSSEINILAIDQASNAGWCTKNGYGVWDFNTRRDESSGMKMLRFRSKLVEVCKLEEINLIVYERVAGQHKNSIIHAAKMVAMIETFCEENNINYKAVSASEIKKFATGKGNANKDKMIESARVQYGYDGNDDNEADAIHIYHHTISDLNI
jgi:Holliday junction resolvasome RuvABC endonuclease subunit